MTHTWRKRGEREYAIGLWLRSSDTIGDTFEPLFTVTTLRSAIRMVNILSGGGGGIDTAFDRAGIIKVEDDDVHEGQAPSH